MLVGVYTVNNTTMTIFSSPVYVSNCTVQYCILNESTGRYNYTNKCELTWVAEAVSRFPVGSHGAPGCSAKSAKKFSFKRYGENVLFL